MRNLSKVKKNRYNRRGLKIGYWEFHHNGPLESSGNFVNGKREGIWEFYHDNALLYSKGIFIDGVRDGIWDYYNKDSVELSYKKLYECGRYIRDIEL